MGKSNQPPFPTGSPEKFNKFLVEEYLKEGSVDEVLKKFKFDLPISYASYQRVLDEWGIIKAAGPNNTLGEALDFTARMVSEKLPIEKLYKKMPPSFKTSAASLYRILSYIKEGVTRRTAAGLIITSGKDLGKILLARDISTPRVELGKEYGSMTIPLGFSRRRDLRSEAVLRVLQSEVFSNEVLKKKNLVSILPKDLRPFMYLDIADVRVEVYHLSLSAKVIKSMRFSSFKLKDFRFVEVEKAKIMKNLRVGVKEAIEGYQKYIRLTKKNLALNPIQSVAKINSKLLVSD